MTLPINIETASKILALVDQGLVSGLGRPEPGKMCVEHAICTLEGRPGSDMPLCVARPDRDFKVRLNDAAWSSDVERAKGLRLLAVAQLGTAGMDRKPWVTKLAELTIRRVVPAYLRIAADKNPKRAVELEAAAVRCEAEGTREAALNARKVANANAADAAAYAANAAYAAAYAAYADAAAAAAYADAAAAAAYADAYDADAAAAYAAAYAAYAAADAVRDRLLNLSASCALDAYRETGSPGYGLLVEMGLVASRPPARQGGEETI